MFGDIKIGNIYHYKGDPIGVNYILTDISKFPRKILEIDTENNHHATLFLDISRIGEAEFGNILKKHQKEYGPIETWGSIFHARLGIKEGTWTLIEQSNVETDTIKIYEDYIKNIE
jgi:hypothetical protein